jgi:hypothetical protein
MSLIEQILTYPGWGLDWGRCHIVTRHGGDKVVVGDPVGNPGTSVVNAIEQIADAITAEGIYPDQFDLYEYRPWSIATRRPSFQRIIFTPTDTHKLPHWQDADPAGDQFLEQALAAIKRYKPYELPQLDGLDVVHAKIAGDG